VTNRRPKRICIVIGGHLSTCPRMVKAADALSEAGYAVRVVSANYIPWAREADAFLRQSRSWEWSVFDYEKSRASINNFKTGLRYHLSRRVAQALGPKKMSLALAARAYSRAHPELLRLAVREPADFVYGGTGVGISVAAAAGRRLGVPFALDLEDYHSAEQDESSEARLAHRLITRIESVALYQAAFLTSASAAIAEAYQLKYSVQPLVINNTFPLPKVNPVFSAAPSGTLKLYWFSQTIGSNRGLEEAIEAIGRSEIRAELHLRGRCVPGFDEFLRTLGSQVAPKLRLTFHSSAAPDEMIALASGYEVGLAVERSEPLGRMVCLTNKAFTYICAGLAVVFTDTAGQRVLAENIGEGACLYRSGDVKVLADQLALWANDKDALLRARHAAWRAAQQRWHWEHPCERGALLDAFNNVFSRNRLCASQ
jgi:glycosyltransferase involved in cell wall biosynthesis